MTPALVLAVPLALFACLLLWRIEFNLFRIYKELEEFNARMPFLVRRLAPDCTCGIGATNISSCPAHALTRPR